MDLIINEQIPGWKSTLALTEMAKIVQQLPLNSKIVEIGSGLGRLTWVLSKNAPEGSVVYAIDHWDHDRLDKNNSDYCVNSDENTIITKEGFLEQIFDCDNIIPIHKTFPFIWIGDKVDMIFIDADEDYENQMSYLNQAFEMIKENGIICGDDYCDPKYNNTSQFSGLKRAVDEIAKKHNKQIFNPKNTWLWVYF